MASCREGAHKESWANRTIHMILDQLQGFVLIQFQVQPMLNIDLCSACTIYDEY